MVSYLINMFKKSTLNILKTNAKKLFYKKASLLVMLLWIFIIAAPSYYFTNSLLIIWNLWVMFYYTEIILTLVISLLFWIFLAAVFYKLNYFSTKKYWIWMFWAFIWVVVSGCPACSITLASYIWLAGIISVFPYSWLELKFISVLLLLYANYYTIKNLELCKIKK